MNKYLFLFSFSPVQAYIEQARKTVDLYAGSRILSHLCKTGINASGLSDDEIIFPVISHSETRSLPNRFIGVVHKYENEIQAMGEFVENAVKNEFEHMGIYLMEKISMPDYLTQIKNYLSINWIFLPFKDEKYSIVYADIERKLGAVKNIRIFEQLAETGRKCSICGERNIKVYRKTDKETGKNKIPNRLFNKDVFVVNEQDYSRIGQKHLQPGEGMCSVCFMKRKAENYAFGGEYQSNFPSTARIAILDALEQLPVDIKQISSKFEAQLIFDLKNKKDHDELRKHHNEKDIQYAKTVLNILEKEDISFTPYYAILLFDGDSMGKWLSGSFLNEKSSEKLMEFHRKLSNELNQFGQRAENYFKNNKSHGRAVYAGGDDFLGFVNLKYLFDVLQFLRHDFDNIDLSGFSDKKLTFSAGIAIAHYKTPLSVTLKKARIMERKAKEMPDKDAAAIAVLKRSGDIHETAFKWCENPEQSIITDIFSDICKALSNKIFSSGFIKNIDTEFRPLMDRFKNFDHGELIRIEISRLLNKAYMDCSENLSYNEYIKEKNKMVKKVTQRLYEVYLNSEKFTNFLSALHIIDFIARKAYGDE